jgi:hypothetical protein
MRSKISSSKSITVHQEKKFASRNLRKHLKNAYFFVQFEWDKNYLFYMSSKKKQWATKDFRINKIMHIVQWTIGELRVQLEHLIISPCASMFSALSRLVPSLNSTYTRALIIFWYIFSLYIGEHMQSKCGAARCLFPPRVHALTISHGTHPLRFMLFLSAAIEKKSARASTARCTRRG